MATGTALHYQKPKFLGHSSLFPARVPEIASEALTLPNAARVIRI